MAPKISLFACCLLLAALLLQGCALVARARTTVPEPKSSLSALQDDLREVDAQIETTEEALFDLVTCPDFEVADAYATYAVAALRTEEVTDDLIRDLDAMHRLGLGYFSEWDRQGNGYLHPQIRMLDKPYVDELSEDYQEITEESGAARRILFPFRFDVKSIREALSEKATPARVEYLDAVVTKAQVEAKGLKEKLDEILDLIAATKTRMAELGVQNGLKNGNGAGKSQPPPPPIPNRMGG